MFGMDLPTIWAGLIAMAVFLYVVLDGFDLGVGILFPFAKDRHERDQMVEAIAPVWDGNETWLVLGGGGLFAAFPKAYATLMPALYIPVGLMLTALIFRGVAFEFRHHGRVRGRKFWTAAFWGGSLMAALAQGLILGGFLQGTAITHGAFSGGAFDWASPFSFLVAIGLALGYALLGATWLIFKTQGALFDRARNWARILTFAVGGAMACVSLATLFSRPLITAKWGVTADGVDWSRFAALAPLPLLALTACVALLWTARRHDSILPYAAAVGVFVSGYGGLAVSLWPYLVPFAFTPQQAAAADNALGLMLVGALIMLPVILGYTAYVYWLFRRKVSADAAYH